ncbi:MAG: peptide chain release factor N(5)-glutamine methyltransferase [Acidobacteriota bacterium]
MQPLTIDGLLEEGRFWLAAAPFKPARREAGLILGHVLGLDEARLLARGESPVASAEAARFRQLLTRRLAGEPVAYLFGSKEFYGRDFAVDSRVLIPRPETEHLVEAALAAELPESPRIADIGTGSGCLAITLAREIETAQVCATDIDIGALEVAKKNVARHGVARRVYLSRGDLTAGLDLGKFDLLVSNPPYVATGASGSPISPEVVSFEPHLALFARGQGRGFLRDLMDAARRLRPGVLMLLEIGFDQGDWIEEAAERRRHLQLEEIVRDYGGHRRSAILRRS